MALRLVFHDLRAPGLTPARRETLLHEAVTHFERATERAASVDARVRVDGIYRGDERVIEIDPESDAQAFAIFQHGLRRVIFLPGVTRDELDALVEVLNTDPNTLDPKEDDLITLLGRRELASIYFLVVETFVEGESDSAAEVQEIIAAGLRERAIGYEAVEGDDAASVRLWEMDQHLVESGELTRLLELSPDEAASGSEGTLGAELSELRRKLVSGLEDAGAHLAEPAMHLAMQLEPPALQRLARLLARELASAAHAESPPRFAEALARTRQTLTQAEKATGRPEVARALFSSAVEELAFLVLEHEPAAGVEAARALARLGGAGAAARLARLARLPPSAGRDRALTAMVTADESGVDEVERLSATLDDGGRLALVRGLAAAPVGRRTLAYFTALLEDPRPAARAHAIGWFTHQAPDHAVGVLGRCLRRGDSHDLRAALYLLLSTRGPLARTLILAFLQSKEFESNTLDDKRLTTLALLEAAGPSALPYLLSKAEDMALRAHARDTRAAAVAALAASGDDEARNLVRELSESRSAGRVVVEEARAGLEADGDLRTASERLEEALRASGTLRALSVARRASSKPRSAPAPQTGSLVPGFSVVSSTLSATPSSAPPPTSSSRPAEADSAMLAGSAALRPPAMPDLSGVTIRPPSDAPREAPGSSRASTRPALRTETLGSPSSRPVGLRPDTLRPPTTGTEERLGGGGRRRRSSKLDRKKLPARPMSSLRSKQTEPEIPTQAEEAPPPSRSARAPQREKSDLEALLEAYVTERPPAGESDAG